MDSSLVVVGLGASAGGIRAVKEFLERTPVDTGMTYVVILHLSPDHDSHLAEILGHSTGMPVVQVTESIGVEPNHIYVVPPNRSLSMVDGHLALSEVTRVEERRAPIDVFFRTLGETHRSRAVGVVLSGTGADGSMGLKRIKEHGGLCFAQDPDDADFADMPRNSIATGMIDDVLPARDIPAKILALTHHLDRLKAVTDTTDHPVDEPALRDIFVEIRERTGHDFSNYKRPTMLRRIARRMAVNEITTLSAYAALVRERPLEQQDLVKDLLISVTHFFRDAEAFATLEARVIPQLFQGKGHDDQVRVWVAGCATGEEAYSIAILLAEHAATLVTPPAVQVFATDLDPASITLARQGVYTLNDAADVAPERLRRFFSKEGEAYRVRQELRESVLFSQHNVIKDPPFSHLDLVSCRNLLIYLNRTAQCRVLEIVHFALRPGRFLFLGSSESAEASPDLFLPFGKNSHLFQSRELPNRIGLPIPRSKGVSGFEARPAPDVVPPAPRERRLPADLHHRLLEQYAAPSLVVSAEHDILHLSASVGRFLELSSGDASLNVLKVVRAEFRPELRSALYQAAQKRVPVEAKGLVVRFNDTVVGVSVTVKPVIRADDEPPDAFLVLFQQASDVPTPASSSISLATSDTAQHLDDEVGRLQGELRAALERHDAQVEEYKAALEEQQAMYEELRAASEELETGREELQSLNEELRTVNQELRIKVEEQIQANDDMRNLVAATEIGTIFLDRSLGVKLFTPSIRTLFSLLPTDRGRPLSDISSSVEGLSAAVQQDAERVLATLERLEREIPTREGQWLMMRAHPYRTADDRIDGVVLTFVDITDRKRASDLVQASEARLRLATEVDNVGIAFFTSDGRVVHANEAFLQIAGYSQQQLRQDLRRDALTPPEWKPAVENANEQLRRTGRSDPYEREYIRNDGTRSWVLCAATMLDANEGVEYTVDITEAKHIEEQLQSSEAALRLMIESVTEYAIITMDLKGRIDHWNTGAQRIFGYAEDEILGQSASLMFTPEDRAMGLDLEELRQAREAGRAADERWHLRKDGTRFFSSGVTTPIHDARGQVRGYVKIARDLTDRKHSEDALRKTHDSLEIRVRERTAALAESNRLLEAQLTERQRAEARVRDLLGRMISIQEDERRRISRDIHDHVGQQIVALKLQLEALERVRSSGGDSSLDEVRDGIVAAKSMIATLDRDIDYFTWELRPPLLDEFGLAAALRRFVSEWSNTFQIAAEFHTSGWPDERLSTVIETNLYRIAQEALNNIHKHSRASVVSVILERHDDEVRLTIDDDGRGFDAMREGSDSRAIGLLGMRERAALAGGALEVESSPGNGTAIYVRVPVVGGQDSGA